MFLKSLNLMNFRNYQNLNMNFDNNKIVLIGDNGQGKSNFIEAITFLAFAKSPRANKNTDLIKWDTEDAFINAIIDKQNTDININFKIAKNGRVFLKVDNNYKKRLGDFLGTINVVLFETKDLNLIKGTSSDRKKYLDKILIQIFPKYYHILQTYNKTLKHRNAILKKWQGKGHIHREELEIWDEQLIKTGSNICFLRYNLFEKLKKFIYSSHEELADENFKIEYISKLIPAFENLTEDKIKEQFIFLLNQYGTKEISQGQTLIGTHKDDFLLFLKNKDAKIYASQGQQRTIAFALKLGEYKFIENEIKDKPVLLLDDVLSELDYKRQTQLLSILEKLSGLENPTQIFIATTNLPNFFSSWFESVTILNVQEGKIFKK